MPFINRCGGGGAKTETLIFNTIDGIAVERETEVPKDEFSYMFQMGILEGYVSNIVRKSDGLVIWKQKVLLSNARIGDVVSLNVNRIPKNFIVVHHGKPSTLYDDSCDGTWLLMEEIYENRVWDASENDYENSNIHAYLNGDFLNLFDVDIQSVIKQVKIPYQKGKGSTGSIRYGENGLTAKIFLLSCYELGWNKTDTNCAAEDGAKLEYFISGTSDSANAIRKAKLNGVDSAWAGRSPGASSGTFVLQVNSNGAYSLPRCTSSCGIRPALVLPSDMYV